MDNIDKANALASAANIKASEAMAILERLEASGLTIYKKKVANTERRPASSTPMSDALRAAIREFYRQNPEATQSAIAAHFNVNSGRVAESLRD